MKVITTKQQITIPLRNINNEMYIGCMFTDIKGNEYKGIVHRAHYENGSYIAYRMDELTKGNNWNIHGKSLTECVEFLINKGYEVYAFDTSTELLTWLLK